MSGGRGLRDFSFQYLCHAAVLFEIDGVCILTDPWLGSESWGGTLALHPQSTVSLREIEARVDVIFFSHAHDDHFHLDFLAQLSKDFRQRVTVVIPSFDGGYFRRLVSRVGFHNVLEIGIGSTHVIAGLAWCCYKPNLSHDVALTIFGKNCRVFLQTDAIFEEEELEQFSRLGNIDIGFFMPGQTGIFPSFYEIEGSNLLELMKRKQQTALEGTLRLVSHIAPTIAVPYACGLRYTGPVFWANLFHNVGHSEFVRRVQSSGIKSFSLSQGRVYDSDIIFGSSDSRLLSENQDDKDRDHFLQLLEIATIEKSRGHLAHRCNLFSSDEIDADGRLLDSFARWLSDVKSASDSPSEFSVLWTIVYRDVERYIRHCFCSGRVSDESGPIGGVDLTISITINWLNRLRRGEIQMGVLSLQNGHAFCVRKCSSLSDREREYWSKLFLTKPIFG